MSRELPNDPLLLKAIYADALCVYQQTQDVFERHDAWKVMYRASFMHDVHAGRPLWLPPAQGDSLEDPPIILDE